MIAYKCAKCGAGELEPLEDGRKAICQYCYSVMVLPTLDPEAFNRATELRQQLQFDQAEMAFERIVAEYPDDSESYWNLVLCRYGIEYVVDRDGSRVPTCHRMSYNSILEDPDYQKALKYADGYSRERYQEEAAKIDRVLKRVAQISHTQPDYDVFISYKESDEDGHRTADSMIAQNIYDALKHKHPDLHVFLSRITLKELAAGMEYEPVIFSALNTAKVMIVVGTSRENMESVWVRNEWSRYRRMMNKDTSKKMAVVFKNMDPGKDFPAELNSFAIQAMEAEGFYMQDLVRGIDDLLGLRNKPKASAEAAAGNLYSSANSLQVNNLMKRGNQEMEEGNVAEARGYFRKALDIQADCAGAWWGLLYVDTAGLTQIDISREFSLSQESQRCWNMVKKYAQGRELSQYETQMQDYQQRWTAARYHEETEKAFEKIRSATENGKNFDQYSQYCSGSKNIQRCLEIADQEQKKQITQFVQRYENNHEKFRELQELKRTKPLDEIRKTAEYKKREKEKEKGEKRMKAGLKHQNGFFFADILVAVIALAVAYLCSHTSPVWDGGENWKIQIAPLAVGVAFFAMVVKLFKYSGAKTRKVTSADWTTCAFTALLPTIIGYFAYQFFIYQRAKAYIPELPWSCIFVGVLLLLAVVIVLGAVALFFCGHWIMAIILLGGGITFAEFLEDSLNIQEIPGQVLRVVLPGADTLLMGIAAVTLVLCVLLYLRNKMALGAYDRTEQQAVLAGKNLRAYVDGQLAPMVEKYKPYVSAKYLEDMQTEDREG